MPLLDVDNLTRRFDGLSAVNDLSFAIEEGEIRGLIGPNGAGKSTTLRAIFGLTGLTSGEIRYDGHRIDGPARWAKERPEGYTDARKLMAAVLLVAAHRV